MASLKSHCLLYMSGEYLDEELKEHKAKMKVMRERHEAERKQTIKRHKAAMQEMNEEMREMDKKDWRGRLNPKP
jgi:hypothetical protein